MPLRHSTVRTVVPARAAHYAGQPVKRIKSANQKQGRQSPPVTKAERLHQPGCSPPLHATDHLGLVGARTARHDRDHASQVGLSCAVGRWLRLGLASPKRKGTR